MLKEKPYKVFISYSRSIGYSLPSFIYKELCQVGLYPWFDKEEVVLGSNIIESFDELLFSIKKWNCAIVFFDETYLTKEWCKKELDSILNSSIKMLPVLIGITKKEVSKYSLNLLNYNYYTYRDDNNELLLRIWDSVIETLKITKKRIKDYPSVLEQFIVFFNKETELLAKIVVLDNIAYIIEQHPKLTPDEKIALRIIHKTNSDLRNGIYGEKELIYIYSIFHYIIIKFLDLD